MRFTRGARLAFKQSRKRLLEKHAIAVSCKRLLSRRQLEALVRRQRNLLPRLLGALRPLPETTRNLSRQTIAQLAGEHDYLPTMVTFVRNEIR